MNTSYQSMFMLSGQRPGPPLWTAVSRRPSLPSGPCPVLCAVHCSRNCTRQRVPDAYRPSSVRPRLPLGHGRDHAHPPSLSRLGAAPCNTCTLGYAAVSVHHEAHQDKPLRPAAQRVGRIRHVAAQVSPSGPSRRRGTRASPQPSARQGSSATSVPASGRSATRPAVARPCPTSSGERSCTPAPFRPSSSTTATSSATGGTATVRRWQRHLCRRFHKRGKLFLEHLSGKRLASLGPTVPTRPLESDEQKRKGHHITCQQPRRPLVLQVGLRRFLHFQHLSPILVSSFAANIRLYSKRARLLLLFRTPCGSFPFFSIGHRQALAFRPRMPPARRRPAKPPPATLPVPARKHTCAPRPAHLRPPPGKPVPANGHGEGHPGGRLAFFGTERRRVFQI